MASSGRFLGAVSGCCLRSRMLSAVQDAVYGPGSCRESSWHWPRPSLHGSKRKTPRKAPRAKRKTSQTHHFESQNQKFGVDSASLSKTLGVNQLCFHLNVFCLPSSTKDRWPVTHLTASGRTGGRVTAAMTGRPLLSAPVADHS